MHANFMFYSKEEEKKNVAEEWKLWKQQWPWGNLTNKGKRTQRCPHLLLGLGKRTHVKAKEDGKGNPEGRLQHRLPAASSQGNLETDGLLVLALSDLRKVSFRRTVVSNQEWFCDPQNIWQYLGTILIDKIWLGGGAFVNSQAASSCYCSVVKLCPALCDTMDCSKPGSLVLHHLPEFAWIHVHWISDAI